MGRFIWKPFVCFWLGENHTTILGWWNLGELQHFTHLHFIEGEIPQFSTTFGEIRCVTTSLYFTHVYTHIIRNFEIRPRNCHKFMHRHLRFAAILKLTGNSPVKNTYQEKNRHSSRHLNSQTHGFFCGFIVFAHTRETHTMGRNPENHPRSPDFRLSPESETGRLSWG